MLTASAALLVAAIQAGQQPRVVVQPDSVEIAVEESRQLHAEVYDRYGRLVTGVKPRWFSSNIEVAAVDQDGLVTALAPGRARVAAVVQGRFEFAVITVPQLPPATVTLELAADYVLVGTGAPLDVTVRTRLGDVLSLDLVSFESSTPNIATVDGIGRVNGHRVGRATVRATAGDVSSEILVRVVENPAVSYRVMPEAASVQTGDVLRFRIQALTREGREVSGITPAWSVSGVGAQIDAEGNEGVFVAEDPGSYRVTTIIGENLARSVVVDVEERRVPGRLVKVGRGPIAHYNSADMWAFAGADGRDYVYVGTFMHDWMTAWDVTDPAHPILTDSVQVDARRINDVKIHPNNRIAVITREGASDRRNGIVLLDLGNPAHPTILSEYTETVTGGVHNVWIRGDEDLVYACHNGTSELHIIDISDPRNPQQVGRWGLDKNSKTLHDVVVQEGYAYLSYWDDGAIVLDVGAGTHGGTPTEPAFVSQYKYPIGHTHTAWRYGRYLFVGDEIFPSPWDHTKPIDARGYIHVIDYSDIENPREVAKYEVPEAGAHNVWVENDLLYVGYYQGGLRIVDISGELRGDLYRQGREIAALWTSDEKAFVPNWPFALSAQVFKGHVYTSDFNSGLWVSRYIPPELVP